MPDLVVIAGPNGAGKSTAAPRLVGERLGIAEFVNADVIASGLSAFSPESVAIEAGRIMLARLDALAKEGKNFAFETTLASRGFARWIDGLRKNRGYRFHLVFVWLPSAEHAVQRVARRVQMGGHSIPEDVIRRRYDRGIRNFLTLYAPIADSWQIHENVLHPRLIAKKEERALPQIVDEGAWRMIEKQAEVRERETRYDAGAARSGIMGVPTDRIMDALRQAAREAHQRHKALGHPIVIWRDGKVVLVPPEEIEVGQ